MKKRYLNIGKMLISKDVNGPGRRFVIWFQGCDLKCSGCYNTEFWDKDKGKYYSVKELLGLILQCDKIEGVTYTGGEPFLQSENLLYLTKMLIKTGLSVVCYSGFTIETLNIKNRYTKELLGLIDILIDGPYIESKKAHLYLKGSENQRIYFLTDRYLEYNKITNCRKKDIEIIVGKDGINITGFFDLDFWENLKIKL
jgi:anaerobic ribonucleoside-triphosphate reductase activating protein